MQWGTQYAVGTQYTVGMQYAAGTQYTVGVSAKRSTPLCAFDLYALKVMVPTTDIC